MTPASFTKIALALPGVEEGAHQGHPDFRVGGKVFASLGPEGDWAMVKLPPEEQQRLTSEQPRVYEPFNGAWGRQGCTRVQLGSAARPDVVAAVRAAWRNVAPEDFFDDEG